jgi:hypothetical protein
MLYHPNQLSYSQFLSKNLKKVNQSIEQAKDQQKATASNNAKEQK